MRKKLKLEEQRVKAQEPSSTMAGDKDYQRTILRDFVTPGVQGIASSITRPNMNVHSFELKPSLISMVQ